MGAGMSLPETKPLNELAVLVSVGALQIIEQLAPLADHLEQSPAGMVILDIALEVIGQAVDAGGEKRNLHFRGSGVAGSALMIRYDLRLLRNGHRHSFFLHWKGRHSTQLPLHTQVLWGSSGAEWTGSSGTLSNLSGFNQPCASRMPTPMKRSPDE
jgi:hypothetical protein